MARFERAVSRLISSERDTTRRVIIQPVDLARVALSRDVADILTLQRTHGNQHLQRLMSLSSAAPLVTADRRSPPFVLPIQRDQSAGNPDPAPVGWTGKDVKPTSHNAKPRLIGKVWRIPIQGIIGVGNQNAALDARDFLTGTQTTEGAAGRAIVLIPATIKADQPIEVLLHLHGHGLGYREFQVKGEAQVRDEAIDQTESQIQAIHRGGRNIIAVLPQGTGRSGFGPNFDADTYLASVFKLLHGRGDLPKGTVPGPVSFSGHSGGGDVITPMLAESNSQSKAAKPGKDRDPASSRLPDQMRELILFDALHGSADNTLITYLTSRLNHDLAELTNAERMHWPVAHSAYLAKSFRFRGYHSGGSGNGKRGPSGYARRYEKVKKALDQWFAVHAGILGGPGEVAYDGLRANYQVIDTGRPGTAVGHERMMGENRLFEDALKPNTSTAPVQPQRTSPISRTGVNRQSAIARVPTIPADAIPASDLGTYGSGEATRFRRRVYQLQLEQYAGDATKEFTKGPGEDELEEVEDGFEMHQIAAVDCANLLAHARHDRDERKMFAQHKAKRERTAADRMVLGVTNIGIASAHRSMSGDFSAWKNAFNTHYERTKVERVAMAGGEFGTAAVQHMVRAMAIKAIPGYSNHTKGFAVDFTTTQGGVTLGPKTAQKNEWRVSWLYQWLVANAATYGFTQLPSEEWHWDHTPP